MAQQFQEQILFQHRTSSTNDEFVWQCPQHYTAIIKGVSIANVGADNITYRFFINNSGKTFGIGNALGYDIGIVANSTQLWSGFSGVKYPASIGVRSSVSQNIVITGFGILMQTG